MVCNGGGGGAKPKRAVQNVLQQSQGIYVVVCPYVFSRA